MDTKIEKQKLAFIDAVHVKIIDYVEALVFEKMSAYREEFGAFTLTDVRLWQSMSIDYPVACAAADALDMGE